MSDDPTRDDLPDEPPSSPEADPSTPSEHEVSRGASDAPSSPGDSSRADDALDEAPAAAHDEPGDALDDEPEEEPDVIAHEDDPAEEDDEDDEDARSHRLPPDTPTTFGALPFLSDASRTRWLERAIVLGLVSLFFLPMLGSFGLWDPWETHYGEVGRQITERHDWISTWWGSHWKDAGGASEGKYFYSKPILLMWLMAIGVSTLGVNEWGIRIGVCLVAILAVVSVYVFGREVFSRRVGALMAGCVATSPFFFFLSRQAQTDMPFVGLMTVGMCFFMAGVFGRDRDEPTDRLSFGLSIGWILAVCVPQLTLILAGLARWRGGRSSAMSALTDSLNVVVGIGGTLMVLQALPLLAGLWIGRDGSPETARKRFVITCGGFVASWVPLAGVLVAALVTSPSPRDALLNLNGWFVWGPTQALLYQSLLAVALYLTLGKAVIERRRMHLLMFYVFTALATLAKGLLGFMLPGAILFFYILLTREWRLLKRVELLRGILVFIAVSFPWYASMLIRHNPAFYNRFFVHDHFKRLASGVHQIDEGSFEHFVRWLGYGLFPWSALVPAALARFFTDERARVDSDRSRAGLMLLLWALVAFTLFTLSSTKFHHYIFPAVPALAMLVALALDDALDRDMPRPWPLFLAALGFGSLIAWDIIDDPQILKNLFTYKYDRKWDNASWDISFRVTLLATTVPALLGMLLMLMRNSKVRRVAVGLMFASGVALGVFCLDVYMPRVSQTWSQKGVWDHYYSVCDREAPRPGADARKTYCAQPVIAFKLNWRGENYYSANEVIPVRDDDDFTHFLSQNEGVTFYGIMELARYRGEFQRKLPKELKANNCIVYNENLKFVLAKAPCAKDDPERVAGK